MQGAKAKKEQNLCYYLIVLNNSIGVDWLIQAEKSSNICKENKRSENCSAFFNWNSYTFAEDIISFGNLAYEITLYF